MKSLTLFALSCLAALSSFAQIASFTTPDTVCLNTPVNITNTSTGASSYYWNFCVGDINTPPTAVNIGNPGSMSAPVFMDYVFANNNYYAFVSNHTSGNLVRLDFGNSLLNTPTSVNLGNYGGILQATTAQEGIQIVQNEGNWYALIVGGYAAAGTQPRIVKIDFGANITSAGVATNWGNIGTLAQPIDLHVFKEGNIWYGFTVNSENNTITRFNFTNSFNNVPTAVNLGNIGGLQYPTGIYAINDNGFWRVFITNGGDGAQNGTLSSLTRLDFGSTLLNTPTGVNLGNPGGMLHHPRDLTIMKFCGQITGFAVNGNPSYYDLVRLNFNNDLTITPTITSLGNTGNYSFPHSISKLFRVNDDVYTFITNVANNTISRLRFAGCTNASVSSSTAQNPAPVTYSTPGTYNINLTIDDGLPTQASICKQVVVLPPPVHTPTKTIDICTGKSVKIGTGVKYAQYTWNTGDKTDSIIVSTPGIYWVQTDFFGCTNRDSIIINNLALPVVDLGPDTTMCSFNAYTLNAGNAGATYLWQNGSTAPTFTPTTIGKYYVRVTNASGCISSDTIYISAQPKVDADFYLKQDICDPLTIQFMSAGNNLLANPYWNFGDGNTNTGNFTPSHTYTGYGNYTVKFGILNGVCKDTIIKNIAVNVNWGDIVYTPDTTICFNTMAQLHAQQSFNFCWSPTTYLNNPNSSNPVTATPGNMTYYYTADVPGNNLVVNGDFSNGNTGFVFGYAYTTRNLNEGEYTVGNNPQTWNAQLGACVDHTTGNGNMMIVDGTTQANRIVWSEKINVTPNTNYVFSTWMQNLNVNGAASNPPQLQFSINYNRMGDILQGQNTACQWNQYYIIWNSGNNTNVTLSIVNENTVPGGNDYALDDISFAPVTVLRDSVKILVDTPVIKTINDTSICKNASVPLQATGGVTWSWTPATGLSDATISNPVATPTANTQYIVTGTNLNGCSAKDTVQINLFPDLVVDLGPDVTDCAINNLVLDAGNAGSIYLWQDGSTAQTFTANSFGKYYVQVTSVNGCVNSDTIILTQSVNRLGEYTYKIDACSPLSVQFTGTGANLQNPYWDFGDGNTTTTGNFTPSHAYTANGDYTVKFGVESGNCKDTITHLVRVQVLQDNIISTTDTTICFNTTKQLQGLPSQNFCWSPTTWLDNPNVPNPTTSTPSTITYYYTAEINGGILRDSVIITVDSPLVKTNNDTTICKDAQVPLQVTGTAATFTWSPITGLSNAAISNPVATPTANTEYIVTGTTINGCSAKDTVQIALYPVPVVLAIHDIQSCSNTPVQLFANNTLATWTWTPAATLDNPAIANPVATPDRDTKYLVKVTDAQNCSYLDSVNVQLRTITFAANTSKAICKGQTVQLLATGGDAYLWSPAGSLDNASLPNPKAKPDTSTQYSVYITENTCNSDTTINVMVDIKAGSLITAEKSNDLDCVTHSTTLSVTGEAGNTYVWTPASGLDHPNSPNPVSTTDTTITYVVAGYKDGCTSLDSVTVYVNATGKVSFEIPNAFTPNNDGHNDCFGVKTWGGAVIEEFAIFNRWGQKVFSSNNANPCWDGRFHGEQQPAGGYVYTIKAKTYCGVIKRTGTLILVR